jgi:hypothetical protein
MELYKIIMSISDHVGGLTARRYPIKRGMELTPPMANPIDTHTKVYLHITEPRDLSNAYHCSP